MTSLQNLECLFPREIFGCILGEGGSRIKAVRENSKVKITNTKEILNHKYRTLSITGAWCDSWNAWCQIIKTIHDDERWGISGESIDVVSLIKIPQRIAGIVIGKGGAGLRDWRERMPEVQFAVDEEPKEEGFRWLKLTGKPEALCEHIISIADFLEQILTDFENKGKGFDKGGYPKTDVKGPGLYDSLGGKGYDGGKGKGKGKGSFDIPFGAMLSMPPDLGGVAHSMAMPGMQGMQSMANGSMPMPSPNGSMMPMPMDMMSQMNPMMQQMAMQAGMQHLGQMPQPNGMQPSMSHGNKRQDSYNRQDSYDGKRRKHDSIHHTAPDLQGLETKASIVVEGIHIGKVIGPQGTTIKSLRQAAGADIRTDNKGGRDDGKREISVSGTLPAVTLALQLIEKEMAAGGSLNQGGHAPV